MKYLDCKGVRNKIEEIYAVDQNTGIVISNYYGNVLHSLKHKERLSKKYIDTINEYQLHFPKVVKNILEGTPQEIVEKFHSCFDGREFCFQDVDIIQIVHKIFAIQDEL